MPGVQIKTLDKTWNKNEWKTSPWMLCDSSVFDLSSCWTFSPILCEHWTLMQAAVNREVKHWIQRCALQYGEDYSLNAATRSQWSQTMRNTYSGQIQQTVFEKYCKKSWRWAPLVQWWPTMQCSLNAANAAIIPPSPHYVPCLNSLRTPSCSLGSSVGSSCKGCFFYTGPPLKS